MAFVISRVVALKELVDVIEDQIILKDANHMGLFVIDQVIDHLHVFELNVAVAILTPQITHDKRLSRNARPHNARVM